MNRVRVLMLLTFAIPAMRYVPQAQTRCASATGEDSLLAVQHERVLVALDRAEPPIVRSWRWLPADSALCAQADAAVRHDDAAGDDDRLFVYHTSGTTSTYAVVSLVPHPPTSGDWGRGSICFFDARWRRKGTCLAI